MPHLRVLSLVFLDTHCLSGYLGVSFYFPGGGMSNASRGRKSCDRVIVPVSGSVTILCRLFFLEVRHRIISPGPCPLVK